MTTEGVVTRSAIHPIVQCVAAGFVPVLHGDCVLDTKQGCAILSGDKIIEVLDFSFLSCIQTLKEKQLLWPS